MTQAPRSSILGEEGTPGKMGVLFACIWLVFLYYPVEAAWQRRDELVGWVGGVTVIVFAVLYVVAFVTMRRRRMVGGFAAPVAENVSVLGGMAALTVLGCATLGQSSTAMVVYIAVASVMRLPGRLALATVAVLAIGTDVAGRVLSGWESDSSLTFAICTASFAMWGVMQLFARNTELMRARDENAELAVASERNRFARDLHDILGHSLTVITVKAELAGRLLDVDTERARAEVADLERLSRDALADVRRAVEGYRDLTLPGELARAREALAAADIEADLPNSTDEVPSGLRDLFAWTVREGVTNVIRHSGASRCTVRLMPTGVHIRDDGGGCQSAATDGHGLEGLRERASALNAVLVTRTLEPGGFELSVMARA